MDFREKLVSLRTELKNYEKFYEQEISRLKNEKHDKDMDYTSFYNAILRSSKIKKEYIIHLFSKIVSYLEYDEVSIEFCDEKGIVNGVIKELSKMIINGEEVILPEITSAGYMIFYYIDYENGTVKHTCDYKRYSYLGEFIEMVVNTRINEDIFNISLEQLENMALEFSINKLEDMFIRYNDRVQEVRRELVKNRNNS